MVLLLAGSIKRGVWMLTETVILVAVILLSVVGVVTIKNGGGLINNNRKLLRGLMLMALPFLATLILPFFKIFSPSVIYALVALATLAAIAVGPVLKEHLRARRIRKMQKS